MSIRIPVAVSFVLVLGLVGLARGQDQSGRDKEKNTLQSLFDGIPKDLSAKVQPNPVRCDRVNDWLQDNVNGKGRSIEVTIELQDVLPYRQENGYRVHLALKESKLNLLDADWELRLADPTNAEMILRRAVVGAKNFSFDGVNAVDAEKLVDMKKVAIRGKVKEAKISRLNSSTAPAITIILEDVLVEGNRWIAYQGPAVGNPFGKAKGGENPIQKGKGKGGAKKDSQRE